MNRLLPIISLLFLQSQLLSAQSPMILSDQMQLKRAFEQVDHWIGEVAAEAAPDPEASSRIADELPFDERLKPFYHGVASGDPGQDGIILWTRVTPETDGPVTVDWEIAEDTAFSAIAGSGTFTTDSSRDYTVKIAVSGLTAEKTYYYRFEALGGVSITGRTRTAASSPNQLKFGVVSCNSYQSGYFNAFGRLAERNDLDAIIHLGDFIYENERSSSDWAADEDRGLEPEDEIIELNDYRLRYNWYRLDADLRRAMQQHPFILVWDDHETANNSWTDGAENHNPADGEGDWEERKMKALQAYFEWVPIRDDPMFDIQRTISYGDLAEFIMLDTRLAGREEQLLDASDPLLWDADRTILGPAQFDWFTDELKNSTARWKVIGNQVVFAPLLLEPFEPVYPGAANEFLDVWNGYPAEREKILDTLVINSIDDVVFVTGDVHIGIALDVPNWDGGDTVEYNAATSAGSHAVEFVTTSITSSNFDERLGSQFLSDLMEGLFTGANPHGKYAEFDQHGYFILDLTSAAAQADYYYVTDILNRTSDEYFEEGWLAETGDNFLQQASGPAPPKSEQETPAPDPTLSTGVPAYPAALLWQVYPNPATDIIFTAFSLNDDEQVIMELIDMRGQTIGVLLNENMRPGHYEIRSQLPADLAPGQYTVRLSTASASTSRRIVIAD